MPCPVEYKRGTASRSSLADHLQLCAQAICLEEMLVCPPIRHGYIFYGETKRRSEITLDTDLRMQLRETIEEMRGLWQRRYTPRVKYQKQCNSCSVKNICLPKLSAEKSVSSYIDKNIEVCDEKAT
jgi:CRISPR-associated exonuclease Cas4